MISGSLNSQGLAMGSVCLGFHHCHNYHWACHTAGPDTTIGQLAHMLLDCTSLDICFIPYYLLFNFLVAASQTLKLKH